MDAARRLAVVFLDPRDGFSSPSGSINRAFCRDMSHLQIELVPSGVGAMYARFRYHNEREAAIEYGDIFMDDVRISLGQEETAARAPARVHPWCALIWASPFPAEHVNPIGIRAAFTKVGELLEVDPLCLMGSNLSAARAIVSLNDPAARSLAQQGRRRHSHPRSGRGQSLATWELLRQRHLHPLFCSATPAPVLPLPAPAPWATCGSARRRDLVPTLPWGRW
jgi:hypothetical protein